MDYPIYRIELKMVPYIRCYAFPRMAVSMHYVKGDYIVPLIIQQSAKMCANETATSGHKHTRHIVSLNVGGEHTFAWISHCIEEQEASQSQPWAGLPGSLRAPLPVI